MKTMICFCLVLLALGHTEGNYPASVGNNAMLPSQRNYPNEVLATENFKVSRGPWFNLVAFEKGIEEDKSSLTAANAPQSMLELYDAELPKNKPMEFQMATETREGGSVFCALGFWLNPRTKIQFQSSGLKLTLEGPQGQKVETTDQGCLFLATHRGRPVCYDSSEQMVTFDRNFNNKPDYRKMPNIVYLRLDPQYYNWKITGLALDSDKVVVQ
ncbi:hypothetical protein C0580_02660 [Candidatus Parcubacteria bacterium]|nr:MAG: hypothetical protein C0580_02660 [Candidatus Parcubacteria bacterium]